MKTARPPAIQSPDLLQLCTSLHERSPIPMAAVQGPLHSLCYVNSAFEELLKKPKPQLIGKGFREIMLATAECVAALDRVVGTGQSETFAEREHSRPQPIFWSYTLWSAFADKRVLGTIIQVTETGEFHQRMVAMNEALVLGSLRQHELVSAATASNEQLNEEITARKETEEVLHRARIKLADRAGELETAVFERTSELTSINKQLDAFVYTIAHDLRAPLRSMQGFSTMLIEDGGSSLSETGRNFANRINLSAQFMDSLLQDLLAFSRVAQERIQLSPVNLKAAVQAVVTRLESLIQQKNATIEINGPWPTALAHAPTLGQVLTNLISNSLKFNRAGVSPIVRVHAEEQKKFIRVWVEDNGVGIPADQREKIFQLFTRLNGEKFPGTGIGLAIVQKGVERMGGFVGVESAAGQGTRFWFELKKA
jgi:signal transduction histidine kinase